MKASDNTLKMIVIDDSSNYTETISSILRNAGHAVRTQKVEDDEDLREVLENGQWDMILTKPEVPLLTAEQAMDTLKQRGEQIPILILSDDTDEAVLDNLLTKGARETIDTRKPQRLIQIVLRAQEFVSNLRRIEQVSQLLDEATNRAEQLVDTSRDAIAYAHEGMHIYVNASYLSMFGYSAPGELEGTPLMNMIKAEGHTKFKKFLRDYTKGTAENKTMEVTASRADGSNFEISMEFGQARYDGEPCVQIIIRDQAASQELAEKLNNISKKDLLSGAYNRQHLIATLEKIVGKNKIEGILMMLEPDGYKKLRDDSDITAGDRMLVEFATLVTGMLPGKHDLLARFEGQQFTAIVHGFNEKKAEELGDKIRKMVEEHIFNIGDRTTTTTCSIGISLFNESIKRYQEVLTRAEKGLQQVRDNGGNGFLIHKPDAKEMEDIERYALIAKSVREALRANRIHLAYAPIVSLEGDPNANYEVHIRMQDEKGSEIPPGDFIPASKQHNLMIAIDRWVIANSIKTIVAERRKGKPVSLSVELSSESIADPKFLPWLHELLKSARIKANTLTIEVNEQNASNQLKELKRLVKGANQLKVRIAINHFGVMPHYANLLKHADANLLKLDSSLCANIANDQEAFEKMREVNDFGKNAGKATVAVGIEDPQTLAMLYTTGISYIQGPFFGEPSPSLDFDFSSMG